MSITSKDDLLKKQTEAQEEIQFLYLPYPCLLQVPAVSLPDHRRFMMKCADSVRELDGVEVVSMQKDVPHIGTIKTGCQGLM